MCGACGKYNIILIYVTFKHTQTHRHRHRHRHRHTHTYTHTDSNFKYTHNWDNTDPWKLINGAMQIMDSFIHMIHCDTFK